MPKQLIKTVGVLGTIACLVIFALRPSWPTPDKLIILMTFIFMIFGQAWEMLRRFFPFVALLLIYDSFRGIVPQLNSHVNYTWMIEMDRLLFAGELPTAILQSWWWHGSVQWYDFVFYFFYTLHFIMPLALAVLVWKLKDSQYWRVVSSYVLLSFAGFFTYLLFPAAPPWMAQRDGFITGTTYVASKVWEAFGVNDFPSLYNKIAANPVAAVPSLHSAYATLFALYVTTLFKNKWRWLAWIYPLMIYVGTVYQGDHYVIDAILGILYAVVVFWVTHNVLRGVKVITSRLASKDLTKTKTNPNRSNSQVKNR